MNNNPQVVAFANDRVRPLADSIYRLHAEMKSFETEYFGKGIGGAIDAAGAAELIGDGSAIDGRTPITGGDIYTLIGIAQALIGAVEDQGRLGAVAKIEVNGNR
jgi:hypothetical protein